MNLVLGLQLYWYSLHQFLHCS